MMPNENDETTLMPAISGETKPRRTRGATTSNGSDAQLTLQRRYGAATLALNLLASPAWQGGAADGSTIIELAAQFETYLENGQSS